MYYTSRIATIIKSTLYPQIKSSICDQWGSSQRPTEYCNTMLYFPYREFLIQMLSYFYFSWDCSWALHFA